MSTAPRRALPPEPRRWPCPPAALVAVLAALVLVALAALLPMLQRREQSGATVTPQASQSPTPTPWPTPSPLAPSSTPAPRGTAVVPSTKPAPAVTMKPVTRDGTWLVSTTRDGIKGGKKLAVAVEHGLPIDPNEVAAVALAAYNDKRGWASKGYRFQLVTSLKEADVVIHVASPTTTDKFCYPLKTDGRVSCTPTIHAIYLNSDRWRVGVPHVPDLAQYRRYLVSHEMGHALGFLHVPCPAPGKPAPVMLQQTLDLKGCKPNEWVAVA